MLAIPLMSAFCYNIAMNNHFGEHVTIDGYGGDKELLNDKDLILGFLDELLAKLEMHALTDPYIVLAPDNNIKDPGGWSAFVVIAESHISIHTFPRREFVSADVYTCRNGLDSELIQRLFKDKFKLQEIETNFIIRGTKYPEGNIHSI
jgi:S-adenosylmethionine decarboxylase